MATASELFDIFINSAQKFGMVDAENYNGKRESSINARSKKVLVGDENAYFGVILPDQNASGAYGDFSLVVFPDKVANVNELIIALSIGTMGFDNDYASASMPGTRRLYQRLKTDKNRVYLKVDFSDYDTVSNDLCDSVESPNLRNVTLDRYGKSIVAAEVIKFDADLHDMFKESRFTDAIERWLAVYAQTRGWGTTKKTKAAIDDVLKKLSGNHINSTKQEQEVRELLMTNNYVVLQGAPGTGKTHTALKIMKDYGIRFFTQFHAETTYADFVYGIEPNLDSGTGFRPKKGILLKAIEAAVDNPGERVILVIDEINRANLSNVLGPVFFLFEKGADRSQTITIGGEEYPRLPDNLHVLATMNTADRSLAVVDFALRRRFAWYTMKPHPITVAGKYFDEELFNSMKKIFDLYATDDELSLQPGQSYFIFNNDKDTHPLEYKREKRRMLEYELMPLVKEYLAEGFLTKAHDDFSNFFLEEGNLAMYE